jgi:hypothetical protein
VLVVKSPPNQKLVNCLISSPAKTAENCVNMQTEYGHHPEQNVDISDKLLLKFNLVFRIIGDENKKVWM